MLSRTKAVQIVKSLEKIPIVYYHQKLIQHVENPFNVGSLDKNDKSVGTGLVGSPSCGNVMKFQIQVAQNGQVTDAKFKTYGCGSAIACCSLATKWVKGKTLTEVGNFKDNSIAEELSLPKTKLHVVDLAKHAVIAALDDYRVKQDT